MKRRVIIFRGIGVEHYFSQTTLVEFENNLILEYLIQKRLELEKTTSTLSEQVKKTLGMTNVPEQIPLGDNNIVVDPPCVSQTQQSDDDNKQASTNDGDASDENDDPDDDNDDLNDDEDEPETEIDQSKSVLGKYSASLKELKDLDNDGTTAAMWQREANLRGVPLSLLTELSRNGYEDMAMDMIGYFQSVASTSFEKLSDVVVLLSNTLMRYETLENETLENNMTINPIVTSKMYLLLLLQEDGNMVLLKDDKTLNKRFNNIKSVYDELRKMVNENTTHELPELDTMKRYCRCYWRVIQWYMDNVMEEYMFNDAKSKELCQTKLFDPHYAYHEFYEMLTTFINSILITDKKSTPGVRTLLSKKGGVTLWLSRQTRKKWYIPKEDNVVERVLIFYVMESVNFEHDLGETIVLPYKNVRVSDNEANPITTEIDIPYKFSKKANGNKKKPDYSGYEKILTLLMREPSFDRVYILPKTPNKPQDAIPYTMSDLEPNEFLENLVKDHIISPGAPIIFGATSYHIHLGIRMMNKFEIHLQYCRDNSIVPSQQLCPHVVNRDEKEFGRQELEIMNDLDVVGKRVSIVLSKKIKKTDVYQRTSHANRYLNDEPPVLLLQSDNESLPREESETESETESEEGDSKKKTIKSLTENIKSSLKKFRKEKSEKARLEKLGKEKSEKERLEKLEAAQKKASEASRKKHQQDKKKKEDERKKSNAKKAKEDATKKKNDEDQNKVDADDGPGQPVNNTGIEIKRKFVQYLKRKNDDDDGQEQKKKGKVHINIDVTSTLEDNLTRKFKDAYKNDYRAIRAITDGVHLVLVSNGEKIEEIEFTRNDFEDNSDNDTDNNDTDTSGTENQV